MISILLDSFDAQLTPQILGGFERQGLSVFNGVTIASIVQREAVVADEMPLIASVLLNRLAASMRLEADPTVQYALGYNQTQETWWTNPLSARNALPRLLEDAENGLSFDFRELLQELQQDLAGLDDRVGEMDKKIRLEANNNAAAKRLQQIPGIGPITATALVCAIGDGKQFKRGRDLAAWLGLTPRQHSTGGKDCLLGISKRGDTYLRTLLIHGARAVLKVAAKKDDPRSCWIQSLCSRRNKNIAAVALANKNARIVWALLTKDRLISCRKANLLEFESCPRDR